MRHGTKGKSAMGRIKESVRAARRTAETRAALAERFKCEAEQLANLKDPCYRKSLDCSTAQVRLLSVMPRRCLPVKSAS